MHIRVNGNPAPQGSVKAFAIKKGGQYNGRIGIRSASPHHADWRNAVALEAAREMVRAGFDDDDQAARLFPADVPVTFRITFYLPRPAHHYGTGRNSARLKPSAPAWPLTKDIDKLVRTVLDALQLAGIVDDDRQFVGTSGVWRVYAEFGPPGADIWVDQAPAGIPALSAGPAMLLPPGAEFRPLVDLASGELLARGTNHA